MAKSYPGSYEVPRGFGVSEWENIRADMASRGKRYNYQTGTWFSIEGLGFDELPVDITILENKFPNEAAKVLAEIAEKLRIAAQRRSPYLYGVLREAHFDTLLEDSMFWEDQAGLVAIDPSVTHHVLGGKPNEYGAEIHAGQRGVARPWFSWTIEQEGKSILEEAESELIGVYKKYLNRVMF